MVLPTSLSGLVTGALLAVARGAGETAPLLFTVAFAQTLTGNLNGSMNSLPIQIYNDIQSPRAEVVTRAWGAALTLVLMILLLNLIARAASRRSRLGMNPEIDTKNKDAIDVSTADQPAGQPQQTAEPAARARARSQACRALGDRGGPARLLRRARSRSRESSIKFPANEVTALIGPSGSRQVDGRALHQPDARGDPRALAPRAR